ncbi:methylisocitrate lyase [Pseudogemmobacter sonorensis]|uniref:methylisocitrate lyase n=1 Tax=Pseudogemmobacter sonorensis TaxID=2989681 RepID=UPI003678C5D4
MPYLIADDLPLAPAGQRVKIFSLPLSPGLPLAPAGQRFRAALSHPGILRLPGAHNGQAALQGKAAGFDALYLSGAAMTASMGLPDLGIITVDEVAFFIRQIARALGLPLLVDGDTGYDEALNVMHMVRGFEEAGAGAVHLEDQLLPKKCGHLNDKKLASAQDMAATVAAADRARRDLVIIARIDAAASDGIEGAAARAKLYVEAGADAIFPEALTSVEMFREVRARLPGVKLLANMTESGRTPALTAQEFQDLGFDMVIWPVPFLRVANKAQAKLYAALTRDGATTAMLPEMQARAELYDAIGLNAFEALDASIALSVAP